MGLVRSSTRIFSFRKTEKDEKGENTRLPTNQNDQHWYKKKLFKSNRKTENKKINNNSK